MPLTLRSATPAYKRTPPARRGDLTLNAKHAAGPRVEVARGVAHRPVAALPRKLSGNGKAVPIVGAHPARAQPKPLTLLPVLKRIVAPVQQAVAPPRVRDVTLGALSEVPMDIS